MRPEIGFFAVTAVVAVAGCSRTTPDPERLLISDAAFSAPIAVLLPQAEQTVCSRTLLDGATTTNYAGELDIQGLALGRWATVKSTQMPGQVGRCIIYKPHILQQSHQLIDEFGASEMDRNARDTIYMPIAKRDDLRITWQNAYETDIPGKGPTKVVAVTCTYRIHTSGHVTGISTEGSGSCQGKWFFDNDTGEWRQESLHLSDPPFLIAVDPTEQTGNFSRVMDMAKILSWSASQKAAELSDGLERKTGDQLVVLTVASLGGDSIESFSYKFAGRLGLGQRGKNNGVLLVVAPHDRKVRIEVGYGLEHVLSDAACKAIIGSEILPAFRRGDYDAGILAGEASIVRELSAS
jgi:TPM domain